MALSPNEVEQRSNLAHQAEYDRLIESIDSNLVIGGRTVSIQGLKGPVIDKVIKAYEYVGWKVRVVPDNREGPYLEFTT